MVYDELDINRNHQGGGFGRVAKDMVDHGWSVFPQTKDRKPGSITRNGHEEVIKWKDDHHLDRQLPDPHVLKKWIEDCGDLNVACVFGKACSNAFAIDIDITDRKISRRVEKIFLKVLGQTPLRRIGRAPKVALFYRSLTPIRSVALKLQKFYDEATYETLEPEDKSLCRRRVVHDEQQNELVFYDCYDEGGDPQTDDQMIEIAGTNKLMTIWGIHHKTDRPFNWMIFDEEIGDYRSPVNTRPEELPVVSPEQVQDALDKVFAIYNQYYGKGMAGGLRVGETTSIWTEDADGKISDGRENWLFKNCASLVMRYYDEVKNLGERKLSGLLERLTDEMAGSLNDITDYGQFGQYCVIDGKWSKDEIRNQARSKLVRQMIRICRGEVKQRQVIEDHKTITSKKEVETTQSGYSFSKASDEFGWMTQSHRIVPFGENDKRLNFKVMKPDRDDSMEIPENRQHIMDDIADGIQGSITSFLDRIYMQRGSQGFANSFTEMLVAPTGSGKTSQFLQRIAQDPRTHLQYDNFSFLTERQKKNTCHPFIFMMPNYENITEQFKKVCIWGIDTKLSDEDMAKEASERGYGDFSEALADIDFIRYQASSVKLPAGVDRVRVMIWKGKVRAGCKKADLVKEAGKFGYGAQNFCRKDLSAKEKEENPEKDCHYCDFYQDCPFIAQKQQVNHVDLVFMPHAFIQLSEELLPEPLRTPRAVLVDERVYQYFLHTEMLDIEVLKSERSIPAMSHHDKQNFEEEDYFDTILERQTKRNEAVDILLDSLSEGLDTARVFANLESKGKELLTETIKLIKGNLRRDMRLKPNMDIEDVRLICDVDNGRYLREELQLWSMILERMNQIIKDAPIYGAIESCEDELTALQNIIETEDDEAILSELNLKKTALEERKALYDSRISARGGYDYRLQVVFSTPEHTKTHNIKVTEDGTEHDIDVYNEDHEHHSVKHQTDYQFRHEPRPFIRMSWRTKPNWMHRPTILLDASAAPEIIRKIWGTNGLLKIDHGYKKDWVPPSDNKLVVRNIVSEDQIGKSLNMRMVAVMPWTNSASSFSGKSGAMRLEKTRQLLDCVSMLHGESRVVCGSNKGLRNKIRYNWHGIENQDWCHFGAMRGLDMFKNHAAAVYIGRLELPIHLLDGLVAALTYDDERPEPPLDIWGTGFREAHNGSTPLMMPKSRQIHYVRNGSRMSIDVPKMPDYFPVIRKNVVEEFETMHGDELPFKWGQLIQKQYREEEIMQFVGRLRPVYRSGRVPTCYAFSTVIPENVIIDEVVHVDEIINGKTSKPDKPKKASPSKRYMLAAFLERHGVIGDHIIRLVGDFVSSNVRKLLLLNGMNPDNGAVSGRTSRGFGVIEYEYMGDSYYAFVPTYRDYEESCDIIRKLIMLYDMGSPEQIEFTRKTWPLADNKASIRKEDNVDLEFGKDRHDLQQIEEGKIGRVMMYDDEAHLKDNSKTYHQTERLLLIKNSSETMPYSLARRTLEALDD